MSGRILELRKIENFTVKFRTRLLITEDDTEGVSHLPNCHSPSLLQIYMLKSFMQTRRDFTANVKLIPSFLQISSISFLPTTVPMSLAISDQISKTCLYASPFHFFLSVHIHYATFIAGQLDADMLQSDITDNGSLIFEASVRKFEFFDLCP